MCTSLRCVEWIQSHSSTPSPWIRGCCCSSGVVSRDACCPIIIFNASLRFSCQCIFAKTGYLPRSREMLKSESQETMEMCALRILQQDFEAVLFADSGVVHLFFLQVWQGMKKDCRRRAGEARLSNARTLEDLACLLRGSLSIRGWREQLPQTHPLMRFFPLDSRISQFTATRTKECSPNTHSLFDKGIISCLISCL